MVKILLILLVAWFFYRLFGVFARIRGKKIKTAQKKQTVDTMVCCVNCKFHIPLSEAVLVDNQYYCAAHKP